MKAFTIIIIVWILFCKFKVRSDPRIENGSNEKMQSQILRFKKTMAVLNAQDNYYFVIVNDKKIQQLFAQRSEDYVSLTRSYVDEKDDSQILMQRDDLRFNFLYLIASTIFTPVKKQIFADIYVWYSVMMLMLNFRICTLFFIHAASPPDRHRSKLCSRMASYLNQYSFILPQHRIIEFLHFTNVQESGLNTHRAVAKLLQNMLYKTFILDVFLEKTNVYNQHPPKSAVARVFQHELLKIAEKNLKNLLRLDFCINEITLQSLEPNDFPSLILKGHESDRQDQKQNYYYNEAWKELLSFYTTNKIKLLADYFDAGIFGNVGKIDALPIPIFEESLTIWYDIENLIAYTKEIPDHRGFRSNVVKILRQIEKSKATFNGIPKEEIKKASFNTMFSLKYANPKVHQADLLVQIPEEKISKK